MSDELIRRHINYESEKNHIERFWRDCSGQGPESTVNYRGTLIYYEN